MLELPLFPLHTVLFPGTPLRLHIFEERYRQMISDCIEHDLPFGVVLIRHGSEAFDPLAQTFHVGTMALIRQVQKLPDGRMNILTIGSDRFKILSYELDLKPYMVGYVEPFPIAESRESELKSMSVRLRRWVNLYLEMLTEAGVGQYDINLFPEDPVSMAYVSASLLQISNPHKLQLLSLESSGELVQQVIRYYRREIALFRAFSVKNDANPDIFSRN
jgi:Lon protease-like protein